MVMDEMVALKRPDPWSHRSRQRSQVFLSSNVAKPQKPLAALATAQSRGLMSGASPDSAPAESAPVAGASVPPARKAKVLDEYDVSGDEEDDDYRTTKTVEMKTKEEVERQARGDVENVKPEQLQKPRPLVRKLKLTAAVQQQSQVVAKTAAVEEQAPGGDKMMA